MPVRGRRCGDGVPPYLSVESIVKPPSLPVDGSMNDIRGWSESKCSREGTQLHADVSGVPHFWYVAEEDLVGGHVWKVPNIAYFLSGVKLKNVIGRWSNER